MTRVNGLHRFSPTCVDAPTWWRSVCPNLNVLRGCPRISARRDWWIGRNALNADWGRNLHHETNRYGEDSARTPSTGARASRSSLRPVRVATMSDELSSDHGVPPDSVSAHEHVPSLP